MKKVYYYKIVEMVVEGNGVVVNPYNEVIYNDREKAAKIAEEKSIKEGKNYVVIELTARKVKRTGLVIAGVVGAVAVVAAGVVLGLKIVKERK